MKESTTEDLHKFYELASEEEEDDEGSPNKSHDTGIHMQKDKSARDKAVLKEKQKKYVYFFYSLFLDTGISELARAYLLQMS